MPYAAPTRSDRLLAWTAGLLLAGLAVLALTASPPPERALAGVALVLLLCLLYAALRPRPDGYGLENDTLLFGQERIPLSRVSAARVEMRGRCPLFPELVLRLGTPEGARALPLSYAGWEAVYRAIRTARPDLGLPPWWAEPRIQRALKQRRPPIRVPKGAHRYLENGTLALFVAATSWLALTLAGAVLPLPGALGDLWIALVVYVALAVYDRLSKPVIVVEDEAGHRHTL